MACSQQRGAAADREPTYGTRRKAKPRYGVSFFYDNSWTRRRRLGGLLTPRHCRSSKARGVGNRLASRIHGGYGLSIRGEKIHGWRKIDAFMCVEIATSIAYPWVWPRLSGLDGLRRVAGRPISGFSKFVGCVSGRHGLEVGGPSSVFRPGASLPIYELVGSLDNCNFASETPWEHGLKAGKSFQYSANKPCGMQFIMDSDALPTTLDGNYDFVASSHMLEHSANPLRVLTVWHRVLKPFGYLILLLPDKHWTFDHRRPVTTMAHLIDDFQNETGEDDQTHIPEIRELHDPSRGPKSEDESTVKEYSKMRLLHQHVFDVSLVRQMLAYSGFHVHHLSRNFPWNIVALAQKNA
jgi:SAM-dependent methyltransferase